MDIASIVFSVLSFLFGWWQETETTKEQCAEMQAAGTAVYPLDAEQLKRVEKCKQQLDDKEGP